MISGQSNRFYHGALLKEAFESLDSFELIYHDPDTGEAFAWVDEDGRPFRLTKGLDYTTMDELKQVLKYFNLDYPRDSDGRPVSTRDLSQEQLSRHQNYIIQVLIDNGCIDAAIKF